ncbi:MAG: aminotransferase class I/II-fold pyridoxal phosphate-dependent enzyme [Myxococcales bacterium]
MKRAGLGALHGHLEGGVLEKLREADRKARALLAPAQEAVRLAQQVMEDVKGESDPVAVGEIEALLQSVERSGFAPTLVLPEMSWSYQDVFPERDYPRAATVRIPLNERHELDPDALLAWIEELRYELRRFPELFELCCKSVLVVINTPHNPTGVAWRRETVLRLLQIAALYDLAVCDDNSYHKLLTRRCKDVEGDACVAQIYEEHREHLGAPVRIHTVGATTKALQGSGDRTGLLHSNVPGCVEYAEQNASAPHLMSLYMTQLKLESGLAVKRYTGVLEKLSADLLSPTVATPPWESLQALLEAELTSLRSPEAPAAAFRCLLEGYEELLRLRERDASFADLSEAMSKLVGRLKRLRLEVRLRDDVERRIEEVKGACRRALPQTEVIEPEGAFYACVRLCPPGDERGVREFLEAIARHRKVDVVWAGGGFVRVSLGGRLPGSEEGYQRFGKAVELYLSLLEKSWKRFEATGRDVAGLNKLFAGSAEDPLSPALDDLAPLLEMAPASKKATPLPVAESERGTVYCIEEGRSVADKVFVHWGQCATVEQLLASRTFRVVYRRLLKKAYRRLPALADLSFERAENQYGPLACLAAYHDRQLIDDVFRQLLAAMYREWHGAQTLKVLLARLDAAQHHEKVAALQGINGTVTDLVNELMHAFDIEDAVVDATGTFAIGCEELVGVNASGTLPDWLRQVVEGAPFAGATAPLDPKPSYVTGAAKRVSDHRYGFTRRERSAGAQGDPRPELAHFQQRLADFARLADLSSYVCKAEQVGPYRMLVVIHKACFHLIADELRLFPQIEEVQQRDRLEYLPWDGVMLFGIPESVMGEGAKTGYVLDQRGDGALLPVAWIAREDATDYVGFFKKTLLTLHNERVKAMGGLPIHGSMITITFKNGLRKTLVFTADSGTGKSETITAMMEQAINAEGPAADLARVDVLSGDMLSLWRGGDGQVYGFGTETGDFLRLTDITERWKARFGDLLERGSYSNLDHPKNPRVTIPGICDARKLLAPTRVNGFFYIDNYTPVAAGAAVELGEDAHQVLRSTLVRGLRKNKGTSGDQPSLRAGLEFAGETEVVTRFRHAIDDLLDWQEKEVGPSGQRTTTGGRKLTCLGFRDGAEDVYVARDVVRAAFTGKSFVQGEKKRTVAAVDYDVLRNVYWLRCGTDKVVLDREVYDQIYEPLVSTFCGNPFVDPEGMSRVLDTFATTMQAAKVHAGVVKTQLGREGYEFLGPAKASRDIVSFLLEDEEVNARFQRNKGKVQKAMDQTFSGVLQPGTNLPVELEGYNLLLLEAHESTHVAFQDLSGRAFTFSTPYYRPPAEAAATQKPFKPAIAMPDMVEAIRDICSNPDHELDLSHLHVDLWEYDRIQWWRSREELIFQVLLVNGIVTLGSSGRELARFPAEVRKAATIADRIGSDRKPVE